MINQAHRGFPCVLLDCSMGNSPCPNGFSIYYLGIY